MDCDVALINHSTLVTGRLVYYNTIQKVIKLLLLIVGTRFSWEIAIIE